MNSREWVESLTDAERADYFDDKYIYLLKTADGVQVYGNMAALYLDTGSIRYDKSVLSADWSGKAELDAADNIVTKITLAEARAARKEYIARVAEERLRGVHAEYGDAEMRTFDAQRKGAIDILAGRLETAEVKFVGALARQMNETANTQETLESFANRIMAHVIEDDLKTARILGIQKGLFAKIDKQNTVSKVQNVEWPTEEAEV